MKSYRLDELAKLASEIGLESRRADDNRLDVMLPDAAVLAFYNLVDEDDTLVGFENTPWHAHGIVLFMTGPNTCVECDELDILIGLASGDLVVVTRYRRGVLEDRWIAHKDEPLELNDMEPGEELRASRLSATG